MPEEKKTASKKARSADLVAAAASSDAAVHALLADRQAATSNEDKEKLAEIDAALVELGYAS